MNRSFRTSVTLLVFILAGCKTQADKLFIEASAKEQAEGLPAAITLYQAIVHDYPDAESADRARGKLQQYEALQREQQLQDQQRREQEALALFNSAEGKGDEEALTIYRRIAAQYSDTEISKTASTRLARIEAERRATVFSDDEYRQFEQEMMQDQEDVGASLLHGTHPTGTYRFTDDPVISRSYDGKTVSAQVVVNWEGVTETAYRTIYNLRFSKSTNFLQLDRLEVTFDNAMFKIDPGVLSNYEQELARQFRNSPMFHNE